MTSVIIIGGGVAGLSAGCYARMNGYVTSVYEMHTIPGGLCTAWKTKGYTIDGCIHWLVGSNPDTAFYDMWSELGVVQGRDFVDHDEYARFEFDDADPIIFHSDLRRLETNLQQRAPEDADLIAEFCKAARRLRGFDVIPEPPEAPGFWKNIKAGWQIVRRLPTFMKYDKVSLQSFADRFKNQHLRQAFPHLFVPEMTLLFILLTFAWLDERNAGYPIGGSLPLALAIEKRFKSLGGKIEYRARVEKILVENNRAVGVRLDDGTEHKADDVISAADAHTTIFEMLGGNYVNDEIKGNFERFEPFQPLIYVGLGLNRKMDDAPKSAVGMAVPLKKPIVIGDRTWNHLHFHPYNYDPTLAPEGKTVATCMIQTDWDYWANLADDKEAYQAEKQRIADGIVEGLDQRFEGLKEAVEVVDVATPLTFKRYTGNWRGSFEGWIATPDNYRHHMPKTLPGLDNFHMVGHWVEIGGGLPPAAFSGRHVAQILCHRDGKKFTTSKP